MHALRVSAIGAGTAAWGLSFLLAAPGFRILADPVTYPQRYELFARQVADPFVRNYGGVWDGDFMGYRILVPAIAHMGRLPPWAAVALIWLAGLLTLTLLFSYLEPRTSARTAWLATLGLAMTPVVQGSHIYVGYPDAVGWLIVTALIVWPRAWLWAAGTFLIVFNDERGLVALPLALALVLYDTRHDAPAIVRRAAPLAAAVVGGLAAAMLVRWGIATGAIGGAPLAEGVLPTGPGFERLTLVHVAGLLLAFKAYWVVTAWAGGVAARDAGARAYWSAVLVYTVAAVYASAWVFDFWRSLAALFPLVLLALRLLHDTRPARLARLLPWLTLIMIAAPQLEQMNLQIRWLRPLPVALYEWWADVSVVEVIRRVALPYPRGVRAFLPTWAVVGVHAQGADDAGDGASIEEDIGTRDVVAWRQCRQRQHRACGRRAIDHWRDSHIVVCRHGREDQIADLERLDARQRRREDALHASGAVPDAADDADDADACGPPVDSRTSRSRPWPTVVLFSYAKPIAASRLLPPDTMG